MSKENKFLTREQFFAKVNQHKNDVHWKTVVGNSRWEYHEKTVDILKSIDFNTVLEAGTMDVKIFEDSDTIDLNLPYNGWYLHYTPTYTHDLKQLPWCVSDKKYDVFIALRVFHHLLDKPKDYFNEMKRISNHTILAFPINVAAIYKNIATPAIDIVCNETDTEILYYKF